ncbi:DUF2254 domain-containing protein [Tsuneonella sp. YG55]|uniref:DUF2254 domain-containing protein n=1 Tax=Tsuneonella litorea TaxID=2976475 RepID=A0A9X2W287_9SPHN|nr:DUF2254 domain-containing protein [Tsuneonella litorea]MCT2559476.1 DUF2254 domain-containing protein [Tsuneonella litorea]
MLTQLGAFWHRVNASYWFYPSLFALGSLALAICTLWLDRNGFASWLGEVSAIQPARPQSASTMLNIIAGSMIGVASTVFSITIAAVAYASGNYGPRLLNNFMEDRGNQISLATFIGTFVYAITVLRSVRREDESTLLAPGEDSLPGFVPQLSLLVAYLLMAIAVAVLVYFLNHVPSSIRINTVLSGIGRRLLKEIDEIYPDANTGDRITSKNGGVPVRAERTGYVQVLDFKRLHAVAEDHRGKVLLDVRAGDFIHPLVTIAYWCPGEDGESHDPPHEDIRDCLSLGSARTPYQDLQFLIDELVEIGLRALSPGINDPFTAITAIHWLGAATARIGARDLRMRINAADDEGEDLVIPMNDDYAHFLARGFGAIRSGVATNRIAALVMLDALRDAGSTLDDESRRKDLERQGDLLLEQARIHLSGPEIREVEARHAAFARSFAAA